MSNDQTQETQTIKTSATASPSLAQKISDKLEAAKLSYTRGTIIPKEGVEQNTEQLTQKITDLDLLTHYNETLLANIFHGLLFIDPNGNVTTYNKAAERILEAPSQEVLFQSFWKNFSDNILGFSLRRILKEFTSPGTISTKIEHKVDGEKEIETEVSIVSNTEKKNGADCQSTASPSLSGVLIIIRDVTEQKHQQVIAQRRHRMNELSEMAAMIAHEIRNPLGGIKGFASLLERDLIDRPDLKQMASYIIDGTNNLNDLVTRVLSYARPIQTHFEPIELISLIQRARDDTLKQDVYNNSISIEIISDETSVIATIDRQSIRTSIINLIVNAIEAMPEGGGKITITIVKEEKHISIKVADTGVGIHAENIDKLFSPFFTTKPDGDGFGLSEVHKIIQLHGGKVNVDSKEGAGSTFTLKIPLSKEDLKNDEAPHDVKELP